MSSETILKMTGITKVFAGVQALKNVKFELKKGEVHALMGENGAGKSTLMKLLIGMIAPEKGIVCYKGKEVLFKNISEALNSGISMIHQELSLVQLMDVAENIWLGREKKFMIAGCLINMKKRYLKTDELLNDFGIHINSRHFVKDLSVAEMQLVELVRSISYDANIIIMDEPTSALTAREIELLYKIIRQLTAKGVAVVFISHKMEEIFDICDRVTILRDGNYIDTIEINKLTQDMLINMVVGRELNEMFVKSNVPFRDEAFRVKNFTSAGSFYGINFDLRYGEVLGFYGLMGAGRTEIMRAIFGIDKYTSGEIYINKKKVVIKSPGEAIKLGMGMLTEDRLRLGAIYTMSIIANTTLASFKRICNKFGFFRQTDEIRLFSEESDSLSIKYSSPYDPIGQLSGGNQQKVLVGRWLLTKPQILILDEPTRGIDIGAKMEIYSLINDLTQKGIAVILVSSELPEILAMSDRIIVIRNGNIVFECSGKEADQVTLVTHAFGL
jgi:ABC-type sugar transport system ATPase subunit